MNQPYPTALFDFDKDPVNEHEVRDSVRSSEDNKYHVSAEMLKHRGKAVVKAMNRLTNGCWQFTKRSTIREIKNAIDAKLRNQHVTFRKGRICCEQIFTF